MLYFHIPFCVSKCAYCGFFSKAGCDGVLKQKYAEALIKQIEGFADSDRYTVPSVYFGGGTPTVLGVEALSDVLASVFKHFHVENAAEITVEANPKTVSLDGLCRLKKAGFNRLSLGAQSFNDKTLKLLKRAHDSEDFKECFLNARQAGFYNINADLIFALPEESNADFLHSLTSLIALEPEHISIYSLSLEKGTRLYEQQNLYRFPSEDEEEEQYAVLCDKAVSAGYKHYEISNFSKTGFESRHNCGYWKRVPYFGFGAGAHSFYEGKRFSACCDIEEFVEKVNLGYLAPTDYSLSIPISEAEAEEERIMLGLRLAEGVDIERFDLPGYLFSEGYITKNGQRIALTEKGFRLSNRIISMLV